jgi:hypothetical protein
MPNDCRAGTLLWDNPRLHLTKDADLGRKGLSRYNRKEPIETYLDATGQSVLAQRVIERGKRMGKMTANSLDDLVHNILRGIADGFFKVAACQQSDGRNGIDRHAFISKEALHSNRIPCLMFHQHSTVLQLYPKGYDGPRTVPTMHLYLTKKQAEDISTAIWLTKEAAQNKGIEIALDILK